MLAIATILFFLSLLGLFFGIVGVLKGSVKFLKIRSVKASALLVAISLAVFVLSTFMVPSDPAKQDSEQSNVEEKVK